ncbi:MAG: type II toxin-antitoxin system RelE/ParE family toxin [Bradyrhizobium sp.]
MLAMLVALRERGPTVGRPDVDTLKGSAFANMKELRFRADRGAWRVAFAFDPQRRGILLVAGDKAGRSEPKFYKRLIAKADSRFEEHRKHLNPKGRQR